MPDDYSRELLLLLLFYPYYVFTCHGLNLKSQSAKEYVMISMKPSLLDWWRTFQHPLPRLQPRGKGGPPLCVMKWVSLAGERPDWAREWESGGTAL